MHQKKRASKNFTVKSFKISSCNSDFKTVDIGSFQIFNILHEVQQLKSRPCSKQSLVRTWSLIRNKKTIVLFERHYHGIEK
jgi:hypothetical protein